MQKRFRQTVKGWDAHYQNVGDIRGYEVIRRSQLTSQSLLRHLTQAQALIIDIGCGTGRVINDLIQQRPDWYGLGLDLSEDMVTACRKIYASESRLNFLQHNIEANPLQQQAEAVLALGVLGYLQNVLLAFENIQSMLKPSGYFIFSINKLSLPRSLTISYRRLRGTHSSNNLAFSLKQIERLLEGRFQVLETHDYCYLPYIPILRRMVPISSTLERLLGTKPTLLSSTTLFVTQNSFDD